MDTANKQDPFSISPIISPGAFLSPPGSKQRINLGFGVSVVDAPIADTFSNMTNAIAKRISQSNSIAPDTLWKAIEQGTLDGLKQSYQPSFGVSEFGKSLLHLNQQSVIGSSLIGLGVPALGAEAWLNKSLQEQLIRSALKQASYSATIANSNWWLPSGILNHSVTVTDKVYLDYSPDPKKQGIVMWTGTQFTIYPQMPPADLGRLPSSPAFPPPFAIVVKFAVDQKGSIVPNTFAIMFSFNPMPLDIELQAAAARKGLFP